MLGDEGPLIELAADSLHYSEELYRRANETARRL